MTPRTSSRLYCALRILYRLLTAFLRLLAWPRAVRSLGTWLIAAPIRGVSQTPTAAERPRAGGARMGFDTANNSLGGGLSPSTSELPYALACLAVSVAIGGVMGVGVLGAIA